MHLGDCMPGAEGILLKHLPIDHVDILVISDFRSLLLVVQFHTKAHERTLVIANGEVQVQGEEKTMSRNCAYLSRTDGALK